MGRPPKLQNVPSIGETLFRFAWWVDQHGYDIEAKADTLAPVEAPPWFQPSSGPRRLMPPDLLTEAMAIPREIVRRRGGPTRNYRPMEAHPGLWREFAKTATSPEGALAFVTKFGLLWEEEDDSQPGEPIKDICSAAKYIANIASLYDAGQRDAAIKEFNQYPVRCEFWIYETELRPWPTSLAGALMIQTGEALTRNHVFRQCANPSCTTWFKVGTGESTQRRQYCDATCRVAGNRRAKLSTEAKA